MQGQLPALSQGVEQLSQGAKDLKQGTGSLKTGAQTLSQGAGTLSAGMDTLVAGTSKLSREPASLLQTIRLFLEERYSWRTEPPRSAAELPSFMMEVKLLDPGLTAGRRELGL